MGQWHCRCILINILVVVIFVVVGLIDAVFVIVVVSIIFVLVVVTFVVVGLIDVVVGVNCIIIGL